MKEWHYVTNFDLKYDEFKEYLDLGNEIYEVRKGQLGFAVMDIPDNVISHLLQVLHHEHDKLSEHFHDSDNPQNIGQIFKDTKDKINTIADFLKSIDSEWEALNNHDNLWGTIIFYFPIIRMQMFYRLYYGYKTYSETKPSYIDLYRTAPLKALGEDLSASFKKFKDAPIKTTIEHFKSEEKATYNEEMYAAVVSLNNYFWGNGLSMPSNDKPLELLYDAIINYYNEILSALNEISKLKTTLKTFYKTRENSFPKSFEEYPDWIQEALTNLSKGCDAMTITQAIAKEQQCLAYSKSFIKTCALCGNRFIAEKNNTRYCNNPNNQYGGKTCRQISSRELSSLKSDIYKYYDTKRKTYNNWIHNNTDDKTPDAIVKELKSNYIKWNAKAQSVVCDYENHNISKSEALSMISLPNIEERSPQLYRFKHK